MGVISNTALNEARVNKKDEFYTQREDIEKEVAYYFPDFKDKVVYCNCDDPRVSNFFFYFSHQFERLKLKKLIATCYKSQDYDLFSKHDSDRAISLEYNGDKNSNKTPDLEEIGIKNLQGDGDFRSPECIELLKQSDIVVTNPPFSLFKEFIPLLIKYKKKFLVLGQINHASLKEIFPLIKKNKLWWGASIHSGDREFGIPDNYPITAATSRVDENTGKKYVRIKGVRWFTNLDYKERHDDLDLYKKYNGNEKSYPKFDYYDAININKVVEIPEDYKGAMAVPITFLDKYNPDQFEIISSNDVRKNEDVPIKEHGLIKDKEAAINGKPTYVRIVIKNKKFNGYRRSQN